MPHPQPPDDPIPPIEVISRQRDTLRVVNKTSGVYRVRSPSLKTARKQSVTPSVEGEGQLARAAAYIWERILRRSSACDEFVPRTPKVPPDKATESVSMCVRSTRDSTSDVEVREEGCCVWPVVAFEADRHSLERLTVTINTLYAPMRRYPVCFSLLLYYDATLPMLD